MAGKRADGEGSYCYDKARNRWQFKLTVGHGADGKAIRKNFYGKTKQEAYKKAENFKEEFKKSIITYSPDSRFGDWMDKFLEVYKKPKVGESWLINLKILAKHIPEALKNEKVRQITPLEMQEFMNDFCSNASNSNAQKMRSLLKSAFDRAIENGICTINPAKNLEISASREEKPRQSYSAEQMKAILDFAVAYKKPAYGIAIQVLLLTGIRRGEMLGLKWSDIDGDMLHIRRGVYIDKGRPTVTEYKTKTGAKGLRDIPLLPQLKAQIETLPRKSEFIFCSEVGTIIFPRNFNREYDAFFMEFNGKKLSPHCCRHTCATLTLKAGADLATVQRLLGHTDPKTTARYVHPDDEMLHAALSGMYERVNNQCGGQQGGQRLKTANPVIPTNH